MYPFMCCEELDFWTQNSEGKNSRIMKVNMVHAKEKCSVLVRDITAYFYNIYIFRLLERNARCDLFYLMLTLKCMSAVSKFIVG
jgi:hypothetical protein